MGRHSVEVRLSRPCPYPRPAAAPRRRWFGRGRTRALLSLGIVLALGVVGTSAYWTDNGSIVTGAITAGKMDLQAVAPSPGTWALVGPGGSYTASSITVSNLTPTESQAFNLSVQNVGQPPFTYNATVQQGSTPAWTYTDTPITVTFWTGTATNTTAWPRAGTCSGSAIGPTITVTATASTQSIYTAARRLAAGTSEQVCMIVAMVSGAANTDQGKTGALQFNVTAAQATS